MSAHTVADDAATGDRSPAERAAHVRVVRGEPDEVELAALVAGLAATVSDPTDDPHGYAPASAWTDRARTVRGTAPPRPGPDTWRWSLRG